MRRLLPAVGAERLAGHFHDTRGFALACIEVALGHGLRVFDSSVAGVGGCPFAPGAPGNVATEAVCAMMERKDFMTGVDLAALAEASAFSGEVHEAIRNPSLRTAFAGVMRLVLNRPARHNALDAMMIRELTEAAGAISADPSIRAVVLAAEGKSFFAGGDLGWMRAQFGAPPVERDREARALFRALGSGQAGEAEVIAALSSRWQSREAREGIAAFFAKEAPPWQTG